jgi:gamma-glutamyltranspeptidase/glutathione hydrolase
LALRNEHSRRQVAARALCCAALAALLTGATAQHAMVATAQHDATQAGVAILRAGGNAVDAAVAIGYALAVTDPCCGNIGGGGFMLIRLRDGRERFIDFREAAPHRATAGMYLDAAGNVRTDALRKGWLAVGVPGTVAGLETARREFGTMSRARLMAPAIALARDGFLVVPGDELPPGHEVPPGARYAQPDLARTLELISRDGPDAFYRGPIARAVVAASDANGGILELQDFARYRVEESAPLHCAYAGYDIASAPPPSSGGTTLCEILNIVAPYPLAQWGWHDARSLHYVAEAERVAFADRNAYLGDPDFVSNPVAQLLSPAYAARLRASIAPERATPSAQVHPGLGAPPGESGDTTHYSIVDAQGNAVAVTYTINDSFGAGVVAGDTGFLLNDEMDDFTAKPGVPNMYGLVQGKANAIAPGKRPLSSMTPTIVTRNERLRMVTGSPGGSRIITTVLETLLDGLVYGLSAQAAVDARRTHMQWLPDELMYEPGAFTAETAAKLRAMGYNLAEQRPWGSAQAILVDPTTGMLEGGSDPRTPDGSAEGY